MARRARQATTDSPKTIPVPGRITDLTTQARDAERINVFINGDFAMGLARTVVEREGLRVGQELSKENIDALLEAETYHRALNASLHFLSYRPRSEGEIRQRLRKSGTADDVVDQVIHQLRDWRYVDDADFAHRWVENRLLHRPRGSRLLAQELRAKGVDAGIVDQALEDAELDEAAQALEIARKRWSQLADLDAPVRERRLIGFLQRRGYDFGSIRHALDALGAEEEDPGTD